MDAHAHEVFECVGAYDGTRLYDRHACFSFSHFLLCRFFCFHVDVKQANTHLYLIALSVSSSLHYSFMNVSPNLGFEGGISVWRLLIPLCFRFLQKCLGLDEHDGRLEGASGSTMIL